MRVKKNQQHLIFTKILILISEASNPTPFMPAPYSCITEI